jgi:hypothetical protein
MHAEDLAGIAGIPQVSVVRTHQQSVHSCDHMLPLWSLGNIIRVMKSRRERWAELLARKEKVKAPADINRET